MFYGQRNNSANINACLCVYCEGQAAILHRKMCRNICNTLSGYQTAKLENGNTSYCVLSIRQTKSLCYYNNYYSINYRIMLKT